MLAAGVVALAAQVALPAEPTTWRWLVWGVPAALIVAGALGLEGILPRVPTLLMLGNASYATYLTHVLVLHATATGLRSYPAVLALPLAIAACVAVGWATHHYVEQPIGRWLAGRLTGTRIIPVTPLAKP